MQNVLICAFVFLLCVCGIWVCLCYVGVFVLYGCVCVMWVCLTFLIVLFTDNWSVKAQRRKTTGTGRMRHLKIVRRRFKYVRFFCLASGLRLLYSSFLRVFLLDLQKG
jgi:hypothetical protein